jgi:hypothetical protein
MIAASDLDKLTGKTDLRNVPRPEGLLMMAVIYDRNSKSVIRLMSPQQHTSETLVYEQNRNECLSKPQLHEFIHLALNTKPAWTTIHHHAEYNYRRPNHMEQTHVSALAVAIMQAFPGIRLHREVSLPIDNNPTQFIDLVLTDRPAPLEMGREIPPSYWNICYEAKRLLIRNKPRYFPDAIHTIGHRDWAINGLRLLLSFHI